MTIAIATIATTTQTPPKKIQFSQSQKGENMNKWTIWIVALVIFLDYIQT
jgi:hypothetical protein